jgi:hypothetical protein
MNRIGSLRSTAAIISLPVIIAVDAVRCEDR